MQNTTYCAILSLSPRPPAHVPTTSGDSGYDEAVGKPVYGPGFSMTEEDTRRHEAATAVYSPAPIQDKSRLLDSGQDPRIDAARVPPRRRGPATYKDQDQDRTGPRRKGPAMLQGPGQERPPEAWSPLRLRVVPRSTVVSVPGSGAVALRPARPALLGGGLGCSALFSRAMLAPFGCGHGAGRRCRALRLRPLSNVAGPRRLVRSSGVPARGEI